MVLFVVFAINVGIAWVVEVLTIERPLLPREAFAVTLFLSAAFWFYFGEGLLEAGFCLEGCNTYAPTGWVWFSAGLVAFALAWAVGGVAVLLGNRRSATALSVLLVLGLYGAFLLVYLGRSSAPRDLTGQYALIAKGLLPLGTLAIVFALAVLMHRFTFKNTRKRDMQPGQGE